VQLLCQGFKTVTPAGYCDEVVSIAGKPFSERLAET